MKRPNTDQSLLERLRSYRVFERDRTIGKDVDRVLKGVRKQQRGAGAMEAVWEELAPAGSGGVKSFSAGGVLIVEVADASRRYEVDVWLRSGGLESLRGRCPRTLRRVRLDLIK